MGKHAKPAASNLNVARSISSSSSPASSPSATKPGFFARRREAQHAAELSRQIAAQAARMAVWQKGDSDIADLIEAVETFRGSPEAAQQAGFLTAKGETVYLVGAGAALIEPRRPPAQWQSGSQGFSFHVAKGVTYRVGQTRGHIVQQEEQPTPIDTGTVIITDQRVVFEGSKATREWAFPKLLGVSNDPNLPWTALQVANRQKVSGFLYDHEHSQHIRFMLQLAIATFRDERPAMLAALQEERQQHATQRPIQGIAPS